MRKLFLVLLMLGCSSSPDVKVISETPKVIQINLSERLFVYSNAERGVAILFWPWEHACLAISDNGYGPIEPMQCRTVITNWAAQDISEKWVVTPFTYK